MVKNSAIIKHWNKFVSSKLLKWESRNCNTWQTDSLNGERREQIAKAKIRTHTLEFLRHTVLAKEAKLERGDTVTLDLIFSCLRNLVNTSKSFRRLSLFWNNINKEWQTNIQLIIRETRWSSRFADESGFLKLSACFLVTSSSLLVCFKWS